MRIQALHQESFIRRGDSPISTTQVEGGGIPKMHPLKSSNPVFKASGLIHSIRLKGLKIPRLKLHL